MWFAVKALVIAALLSALPAGAMADNTSTQGLDLPVHVETEQQLTIRSQDHMEDLAQRVAAMAPAALTRIYQDLQGLPKPPAIEIRLVRKAEDIQAASIPGARVPPWAAGVAFPHAGVIVVATHSGANDIDVSSTVVHELAHMALGAALDNRAPRWLNEGFAYLHSADISLARARTLTGMAWSGDRYRFFEIEHAFPAREDQAHRAYAQSYDFTAFLARRGRWPDEADDGDRFPFRQMLAYIAAGDAPHAAAERAFGVRLSALEKEWWQSLRERYLFAPAGLFGLFVWFVGAILLVLAWLRRRYQGKQKMAQWAEQELAHPQAAPAFELGSESERPPPEP